MTPLETILAELKSLPPQKVQQAASYVHQLTEERRLVRKNAFREVANMLSTKDIDELERAINEGCEQVDDDSW